MKCLEEDNMKTNWQDYSKRILLLLVALLGNAIMYNLFLLPLNLVTGSVTGIATITHYLYGFEPALIIFALSVACIIISFMYLGVKRTMGSITACIMYPILVKLTSNIGSVIMLDASDPLLMVIFAGALSGLANGLMYKSGFSNGGFPIISQILFEKKNLSIAKTTLIINLTIVAIGAFFFGTTNVLYAIIFLYINSLVIDKVLLGISTNKAFYIITEKEKEIEEYIIKTLNHTVTTFEVEGAYSEDHKKVMLTVIPSREYYRVTTGIKEIDEKAFFLVTDSYQVEGAK